MKTKRELRPRCFRDRDSGVTLVEFAIIMPVLFMLLIGMITGGMTLSRHNSIENAVREGTRFGAVNPLNASTVDNYLAQVIQQARSAATGDLAGGVSGQYICASVVYQNSATPPVPVTRRLVEQAGVPGTPEPGQACFADGRPADELRVQVLARRNSEIEGVFFSHTVPLSSRSVTRYER